MKSKERNKQTFGEVLRKAGDRFARDRAIALLLRTGLLILAVVLVLMLADVLFHFSGALRLAGGLTVVAVALAVLVVSVWVAVKVRPPALRMARLLESRRPALGSRLINILQLHEDAEKAEENSLTGKLARHAIRDAEEGLPLAELPPLAGDKRLGRQARILGGVVAGFLLVTIFGGAHVHNSWLRYLDPFGDHPPFSLTRLEIVAPAEGERVVYGEDVVVELKASGHQPKEVFMKAISESGEIRLPMRARGDGTFVARLEDITSDLELVGHTAGERARSHRHRLALVLTPQLEGSGLTVIPPSYTGLPKREISWRYSAVQALEGTKMVYKITSNRPLGMGTLEFEEAGGPMTLDLGPVADAPKVAVAGFTATKSGRMTFRVVDELGNSAIEEPTSSLTVTRDQPPAVSIEVPREDALVVEDFAVELVVQAADDYGLAAVRIHVGVNGVYGEPEVLTYAEEIKRHARITRTLDLGELGAVPGDVVRIFAEAIDTRPEAQLTRSATRQMEIISEEDYKRRLREEADVALIAGKYEEVLERFEGAIAAQEELKSAFAELSENSGDAEDAEYRKELEKLLEKQRELNEELKGIAAAMENFGEGEPVYDFEEGLRARLAERGAAIRESAAQNEAYMMGQDLLSSEVAAQAAAEQLERLAGEKERVEEGVYEPLKDLALLHELIKNFNLFTELTKRQGVIAEQSGAYRERDKLNSEDRLALRELGSSQRAIGAALGDLARKLKHDSELASEEFPEAAMSAQELAEAIESGALPGLARSGAQKMFGAQAREGHAQAQHLYEEMDRLFCDQCQSGQQGAMAAADRPLQLLRGNRAGESLRQMMASRNFRNLPGSAGSGGGGMMASSAISGAPMMLGGESLLEGAIAAAMRSGGNGAEGLSGAPTAKLDPLAELQPGSETSRRTSTPGGEAILLNYEEIADAYFRRLTASSEP